MYVCLYVRVSVRLCVIKLKISSIWTFLKVPEGSWTFLKVHEGSCRFIKVPEGSWRFLKVSEGSWSYFLNLSFEQLTRTSQCIFTWCWPLHLIVIQVRTWHEEGQLVYHKFSSSGHLKLHLFGGTLRYVLSFWARVLYQPRHWQSEYLSSVAFSLLWYLWVYNFWYFNVSLLKCGKSLKLRKVWLVGTVSLGLDSKFLGICFWLKGNINFKAECDSKCQFSIISTVKLVTVSTSN